MESHALYRLLQLDGASLGDGSLVLSLHPDGSRLAAARGPILCIAPVLPTSSSQTHVFGQDGPVADPAGDDQNDHVEQALQNRRATHDAAGPRAEARPGKASPRFACPAASGPPTVSQDDITALAWLAFARPPLATSSAGPDFAPGRGGVGVGGRDSASGADGSSAGGAQGWQSRSGSGRRRTNSSGGSGGLFASIQVMMEDQELQQQDQQQRLPAAATTATAAVPQHTHSRYSLEILLSGTRGGALQLHHADNGAVLLRQQLHPGPVVSIAVRTWRMGLNPNDAVEDVTVGWADAVVRLAVWELRAAATTCYAAYAAAAAARACGGASATGGGQSRFALWGSSPAAAHTGPEVRPLAVQKWEVPSGAARGRSCVVCCGQRPRDLYSLLQGIGSSSSSMATGKTIFLAAGKQPSCLAALEVDEQSSGGGGALSYISSVATSVWGLARTARSVATAPLSLRDGIKSFVLNPLQLAGLGGGSAGAAPSAPAPLASFPDAAAGQRPSVTGVWRQHRDDGRAVLSLAPAPHGSMVAAVDNLGRLLLVELGTMLVSRMWKGYRDAQIAWIEVHEKNVAILLGRQRSEGSSDRKPAHQEQQQQQQSSSQQGWKQLHQKPQHTSQLQEEPPQTSASNPGCDDGDNNNPCQQAGIGPGAGCRDADRSGYEGSHVQDLGHKVPNEGARERRLIHRPTVNPGSHAAQRSSMLSLQQDMAGQPKGAPVQGDAQRPVCEAVGSHKERSNAGEYTLLLAVYAPRRQTLELWFPLQGERLAAIASPPKARLLQRGGGGAGGASGEMGTWRVADAASAASPPMTPTGCMMCFVGTAPNLGSGFEFEQAAADGRDGLQLLDVEAVFGLA